MAVGTSQSFSATVTGTSNTAVTWQVNGTNAGSSTVGTIDSNGTYTAPAIIPSSVTSGPFQVTITAISQADSSASGQALAKVHVTVSVTPATDTIGQGANMQYIAVVTGAPAGAANQGVGWSPSGGGSFDTNNPGIFVAGQLNSGSTSLAVTVTATSTFDPQQSGSATLTVLPADPLGTIDSASVKTLPANECPADPHGGLANGTCYSMNVACDGIADATAYLKVNAPAATPVGTVLFATDGGGDALYDTAWTYGYQTVENVLAANYNTVQLSFGRPFDLTKPNGWLQGPGGVRRLACRVATVAAWVFDNPLKINLNAAGKNPYCATGNSEGSSAVAYAVSEYGLSSMFPMIEPTSGPRMTRLDWGCICSSQQGPADTCSGSAPASMCYSTQDAAMIDAAYGTSAKCSAGASTDGNLFLSDSILYSPNTGIPLPLPNTTVNMLFGATDLTNAVPQGEVWRSNVSPTTPTQGCANTAGHEIPNDLNGAQQIATDIIQYCKVPPAKH